MNQITNTINIERNRTNTHYYKYLTLLSDSPKGMKIYLSRNIREGKRLTSIDDQIKYYQGIIHNRQSKYRSRFRLSAHRILTICSRLGNATNKN